MTTILIVLAALGLLPLDGPISGHSAAAPAILQDGGDAAAGDSAPHHSNPPQKPLPGPSADSGAKDGTGAKDQTGAKAETGQGGTPAAARAPAVAGAIVPAIERYPAGEHLVYDAYVDKAGISVRVGECQLRVVREDDRTRISASAEGSTFGYTLDTTIESVLDRSLHPLEYSYIQRGSEKRQKKLLFDPSGAVYFKHKHCRREDCGNRAHQVKEVDWKMGIIPWGKKRVHCNRRRCKKSAHLVWKERRRHAFDRSYVDMLTAVYEARRLDFDSDDEKTIAVINDHERWLVKVLVKSRGKCKVKAGTFDAVEITVEPVPLEDGEVPENFRGLFGLHGTISIWLDTETRRPLKIRGIVPFGILDLNASVELAKVEAPGDNEPGEPGGSKPGRDTPKVPEFGVPSPAGARKSE